MSELQEKYLKLKPEFPEYLLWMQGKGVYEVFGKDAVLTAEIFGTPVSVPVGGSLQFESRNVGNYLELAVKAKFNVLVVPDFDTIRPTNYRVH